jgi:transposase
MSGKGYLMDQAGEKNGAAKLTDAKVREIFRLSKDGLSRKEIAQKYGVGRSLIGNIIRGQNWVHIGSASGDISPSGSKSSAIEYFGGS